MKIEVAKKASDAEKVKGDLVEKLANKFLESLNYEIKEQVGFTGMEIDLLCTNKANRSKEIYVECKGYNEGKKPQAEVIKCLIGTKTHKKYGEAWLIVTSDFGKGAKGLIDEIERGEDSKAYSFYDPKKLVESLVSSKIIKDENIIYEKALNLVGADTNKLGNTIFLLCEYGDFWLIEYLVSGKPSGIICFHANNGEHITNRELLSNLSSLESSFEGLKLNILNSFILVEDIKLNADYYKKTNDIGINLNHVDKSSIYLTDVFIYPDIEEISDEESAVIKSSKVLIDLENEATRYFIFGDDISGKTSLAYTVQRVLNEKGKIPLYLNACEIKHADYKKFEALLIKKFEKQYSDDEIYVNTFKELLSKNKDKIVITIDDFDSVGIKKSESICDLIKCIAENFKNIIIFANKSIQIEVMANSEIRLALNGFDLFSLKEFGHVLKDELIEKWVTIDEKETISDGDLIAKKDEISKKVKLISGTNFVPTFPLYLLTMLQLIGPGLNLQGSSYAELYGYLINKSLLGSNTKPDDLDFFHTYLSHIAYSFFKNRKKEFTENEIKKEYERYSNEMDIGKSFENVHDLLVKAKSLIKDNDVYQFNHNYTYYFFVAKYLSDHITSAKTREEISKIIEKLYTNEFANIVIFLIHHSKNQEIIDEIIGQAVDLFSSIKPYNLTQEESAQVNGLIEGEIKLSLQDHKPKEYRRKELEDKDKEELKNGKEKGDSENDSKTKDDLDLFEKINLSFKLIEILGQIASSYYGSLKSEKKVDILNAVHLLGMRSLRALLEDFDKFQQVLKDQVNELVDKKKIVSRTDIDKFVDKLIFSFTGGIITTFLKKISDSIASRNLSNSMAKMVETNTVPATKLIDTAVKLNFQDGLKTTEISDLYVSFKDNHLAATILKIIVIEHLYKFEVKISDKQSICDKLKIGMVQKKQMLGKKRKKDK